MTTPPSHVTRLVRLSSLLIGGIVATHTLLEAARDTLFLERIPIANLPWMYVAVAVISLAVTFIPAAQGGRSRWALPGLLLGAGGGTFVFWLLAWSPTHALFYALYLWTAVCGATAIAQFWTTIARLFTLGEAKRHFAQIAVGSVAGSIVGAGLARLVFAFTGARVCVLLASIGFLASGAMSLLLRPPPDIEGRPRPVEELASVRGVRESPYLVTIGALALAMAITATVIDFGFKRAVVRHFAPHEIGGIVSSVALVSYALGGVVQVLLVPRILSAVGTARSLRLLPALLFLGAFAGLAMPYTFVAVGLRVLDGVLRYSLQRTATELLFVPISEAIRGKVKTMLDLVAQRVGQAVASLGLLAVPLALHTRFLVFAVAICAAVWFVLAVRVRGQYLGLFRAMVREGALEPLKAMPELDQSSVEALVAALSSERDEQVVLALEMLADRGKARLIPSLILYHPAASVTSRALELFMEHGRRDAAPLAWKLTSHPDPTVATWAVHAVASLDFDIDRLRGLLASPDPQVAATALVELWARGSERDEDRTRVDELLSPLGDPSAQRALLRALATTRSRRLLAAALPLADRAPVDIQIEIARALEVDPIPEGVRVLVPMLQRWPTRDAARRALIAIGAPALTEIVRALHDETTPYSVRIHLPRSISRFPAEDAVPLLLDLLVHNGEGVVRYKALRGLGRLAADGAVVHIDDAELLQIVERDIDMGSRSTDWLDRLLRTTKPPDGNAERARALLEDVLREKGRNAAERLFRVIALRYRGEDWQRIFDGFRGGRWDASRELVEGVLREPLRKRVLRLLDTAAARGRARDRGAEEPLPALLSELSGADDRVLTEVTAYYGHMQKTTPPASPGDAQEEILNAIPSPA